MADDVTEEEPEYLLSLHHPAVFTKLEDCSVMTPYLFNKGTKFPRVPLCIKTKTTSLWTCHPPSRPRKRLSPHALFQLQAFKEGASGQIHSVSPGHNNTRGGEKGPRHMD